MSFCKDGTLQIPPRALLLFSIVLGGVGGVACESTAHSQRMVLFRSRAGRRSLQNKRKQAAYFIQTNFVVGDACRLGPPPAPPQSKAEVNMFPMSFCKDGTLQIPPRALLLFSIVLGGVGGVACESTAHSQRMVLFRSRAGRRSLQNRRKQTPWPPSGFLHSSRAQPLSSH